MLHCDLANRRLSVLREVVQIAQAMLHCDLHLGVLALCTLFLHGAARRSFSNGNSQVIAKTEVLPLRSLETAQNRFGRLANRHVGSTTSAASHPAALGGRGRQVVMGDEVGSLP